MGLVAKGGRNQDTKLAGTAQSLFMDPCSSCGAPVTIVAAAKPDPFLCPSCAAKARAAAAEAAVAEAARADSTDPAE